MTRLYSSIAIALALSAALTACQDERSPEPVMAPTFARSANDVAPLNDQT